MDPIFTENHWSMNEGQFNNSLYYLFLFGAVVSSLSLKQGPWARVQQSFLFWKKIVTEFAEFRENI